MTHRFLKTFFFNFLVVFYLPTLGWCQSGPPNNKEEFEKMYAWRIRQTQLNGVYIPKDLAEAFVQLNSKISPDIIADLKTRPEDMVVKKLHFSFGRWMIINWSFYEGSRFSDYLRQIGVTHPEDMAHFVMITYHRHLLNKPLDVKQLVTQIKEKRLDEANKKRGQGTIISNETRKREVKE